VRGSAAPTNGTSFTKVPVVGTASNGKSFAGKYTVDHFAARNGQLYATAV
jgi:hypothetical protein